MLPPLDTHRETVVDGGRESREERRADRYDPLLEAQELDVARAELRAKIDDASAALTELEEEIAAAPVFSRAILIARTARHRRETMLRIEHWQADLEKNELRRARVQVRTITEREARKQAAFTTGSESWPGDVETEASHVTEHKKEESAS